MILWEVMSGNNVVQGVLLQVSSCPSSIVRYVSLLVLHVGFPWEVLNLFLVRDNTNGQVNFKNQFLPTGEAHPVTKLPLEQVIKLVKDAFASATERHIEVGDGLEIYIVDSSGVRVERSELKKD